MRRGYAVVHDASGHVIRDAGAIAVGDRVRVRFADDELAAQVITTTPDRSSPQKKSTPKVKS
jgi:exonuclease VII large subunit